MRRSSLAAGVLAVLGLAAGCRHAAPPAPLPLDWPELSAPPAAFAALYRFSCCSRTGLLATVRSGGDALDLKVVMQPAGTVLQAWLERGEGWLVDEKSGCREPLEHGRLPLSGGVTLPLDAPLAALLLTGRLPAGARPVAGLAGWVEAVVGPLVWRARVEGGPLRCTRVTVSRGGRTILEAGLSRFREDGMPGAIVIDTGREHAELALVSWHAASAPEAPAWMARAVCGEGP